MLLGALKDAARLPSQKGLVFSRSPTTVLQLSHRAELSRFWPVAAKRPIIKGRINLNRPVSLQPPFVAYKVENVSTVPSCRGPVSAFTVIEAKLMNCR